MIKKFPIPASNQNLAEIDFKKFSEAFSAILFRKIPTAENVDFIFAEEQLSSIFGSNEDFTELLNLYKATLENHEYFGVVGSSLLFAFKVSGTKVVVAIVSNLDPIFCNRVRNDWLSDKLYDIESEFLLLKQARMDEQTGFFNLANLRSLLESAKGVKPLQLILVEIPGKGSSFQSANRHLYLCCSSVLDYFPEETVIHYLGNYVFGVVLEVSRDIAQNKDEKCTKNNQNTKLTSALVSYLKRAGFRKMRAGVTRYDVGSCGQHNEPDLSTRLLDEAWTAIGVAAKRGPFGFCDFSSLVHPEQHPLYPPDKSVSRKFSRLWRSAVSFSLVCFRSDNPKISAFSVVSPHLDKGQSFEYGNELFVYVDDGGEGALSWAQNIVRTCHELDPRKAVSAGVSSFPFSDFKKHETPYNCHKALVHASFFGKSSTVLFDAVSLNISGDIFFEDGNLTQAAKEYERGIKCDNNDVNLYNSLGVAYTMMNKFSSSMSCFSKALDLDPNNFMTLYNLGLGALHNQDQKLALKYFQTALFRDLVKDVSIKNDLEKQVGILASEVGDYALAIKYLAPWYESLKVKMLAGSVVYHIGRSWHGLKDDAKAMKWLQMALQVDEYDDRAMNLLGQLYFEGGEGDDIALSLCLKSVELNPGNESHRLQLAKIQIHCDMADEALYNLKQCLKNRKCKAEAQLCLAQCYNLFGHYKRAVNWFQKVNSEELTNSILYSNLKKSLTKHLNN